ncbi:hypothetical protein K2Q16_00755 [Patescibacteria group bacterium]|nr:hypothetical protein [Patescibacteria group bacterium]
MKCTNCGPGQWLRVLLGTTALVAVVLMTTTPASAGGNRGPRNEVRTTLAPAPSPAPPAGGWEVVQGPVQMIPGMSFGVGALAFTNCCCGTTILGGAGFTLQPQVTQSVIMRFNPHQSTIGFGR